MVLKNHKSRLTAISAAIHKIQYNTKIQNENILQAFENYKIKIANDRKSREDAFKLGYEVYRAKGYISENSVKMLITKYDYFSSTCIINIYEEEEIVASISLNFKEEYPLPCEELYHEEIQTFMQGKKFIEITRLVIKECHRHSNYFLAQLFQALHIYAMQIKGVQDIVIEVNPRHVAFYMKLLGFSIIGQEKECERVNNAPAILLHLDLNFVQKNLELAYENTKNNQPIENKFFKYAIPYSKAIELKEEFKTSHRPITFADKLYFGSKQMELPFLTGV